MRLRNALLGGALVGLLASVGSTGLAKPLVQAKASANLSLGAKARTQSKAKAKAGVGAKANVHSKAKRKSARGTKSKAAGAKSDRHAKSASGNGPRPGTVLNRRRVKSGKKDAPPGLALGHEHAPGQLKDKHAGKGHGKADEHRARKAHPAHPEQAAQSQEWRETWEKRWRFTELWKKGRKGEKLTEAEQRELDELKADGNLWSKAVNVRVQRQAVLVKKKDEGGKLDDKEQKELDQLEGMQKRHDELMEKRRERRASRHQRARKARKQLQEKVAAPERGEARREGFEKNARRMAKLECSRDVAVAEGRDDLVARIDKLKKRENERHEHWLAQSKGESK